jgi:hypothetical protein
MSPITHFLMGWAVANSAPSLDRRDRALVTWASVVPDIDGLGIIAEWATRNSNHPLNWWSDYHHVLGHNIGFAILVSASAAILARQKLATTLLLFVSFHLHLLGDLVGARGPDGYQVAHSVVAAVFQTSAVDLVRPVGAQRVAQFAGYGAVARNCSFSRGGAAFLAGNLFRAERMPPLFFCANDFR